MTPDALTPRTRALVAALRAVEPLTDDEMIADALPLSAWDAGALIAEQDRPTEAMIRRAATVGSTAP